jgi:hypothetical protein
VNKEEKSILGEKRFNELSNRWKEKVEQKKILRAPFNYRALTHS